MATFHHSIKSGKKGSAAEHAKYITRKGKYRGREDLVLAGSGNMPSWAQGDTSKFWCASDAFERKNGAVYREHEIALPSELTRAQQCELALELIAALVGEKPYEFAIHAPISSLGGEENPHLHAMYSDRVPDGIDRTPEMTFARYNAVCPGSGGCRKDSGGKDRLALRDEVTLVRSKCADVISASLAKHGHQARVDHRSLTAQGVSRVAEEHFGQARIRGMSDTEKARHIGARRAENRL